MAAWLPRHAEANGVSGAAAELQTRFEVRAAKGRWVRYDAAASAEIARAIQAGHEKCELDLGEWQYVLDFVRMVQRNVATGSERPIRSVSDASAAKTTALGDAGSWRSSWASSNGSAQGGGGYGKTAWKATACGEAAPPCSHIKLVRGGQLGGASYGLCTYKIFESHGAGQEADQPVLLVWLHGADMGEVPQLDLLRIRKRLGRRTYFLVPMNPKAADDGRRFCWGVAYTKAQNRNQQGFIFGEPCQPFLADLCGVVKSLAEEVSAARVFCFGYSMGGFGTYQLAGHAPGLFDGAAVIAGYGQGTLESEDSSYRPPQPASRNILQEFLNRTAASLARLPALVVVHAESDSESSYKDACAIVERIRAEGGSVEFVTVSDEQAESDPKAKKSRNTFHRYFNYALLDESSEDVIYKRLGSALAQVPARCCSARSSGPGPDTD